MIGKNTLRQFGMKAAALTIVGMGLALGGCNKSVKEENAQLTAEATALREQNAAMTAENSAMKQQMEMLRTQQAPRDGGIYVTNGGNRSDGGGVSGRSSGGTTVITVAGDVLFGPGSATIKPEARKELDQVVRTIKNEHSARSIRVEGYTDSDPIKKSKWGSNEALSQARAEAVRDYLSQKGVSSSRMSAMGMGSAKPKANKKDSRRVEVVIVDN